MLPFSVWPHSESEKLTKKFSKSFYVLIKIEESVSHVTFTTSRLPPFVYSHSSFYIISLCILSLLNGSVSLGCAMNEYRHKCKYSAQFLVAAPFRHYPQSFFCVNPIQVHLCVLFCMIRLLNRGSTISLYTSQQYVALTQNSFSNKQKHFSVFCPPCEIRKQRLQ